MRDQTICQALGLIDYCVNELSVHSLIKENLVMLNEMQHLNAESLRWFAALTLTGNYNKTLLTQ